MVIGRDRSQAISDSAVSMFGILYMWHAAYDMMWFFCSLLCLFPFFLPIIDPERRLLVNWVTTSSRRAAHVVGVHMALSMWLSTPHQADFMLQRLRRSQSACMMRQLHFWSWITRAFCPSSTKALSWVVSAGLWCRMFPIPCIHGCTVDIPFHMKPKEHCCSSFLMALLMFMLDA